MAPFAVGVVIPTILRPSLLRAVRTVFAQDMSEPFQVLIGIDIPQGDPAIIDILRQECPSHITLTVVDLGYSTSTRHGGFYPNHYSGSLRTVLSYAANSRSVAYLDDDDWWAPNHLSSLVEAIDGRDWAFSYRWLVDRATGWPICRDEWDSVGPGRGINQERFGGFISPSNLILNKNSCHFVFPHWSLAAFTNGSGEDRLVFDELLKAPSWASTGRYSCFYEVSEEVQTHAYHAQELAERGIAWNKNRSQIADISHHFSMAQEALEHGRMDAAAKAAGQALALNPHHAESLLCLALAEWANGNLSETAILLDHAMEVDGHNPAIAQSRQKFRALPEWQRARNPA